MNYRQGHKVVGLKKKLIESIRIICAQREGKGLQKVLLNYLPHGLRPDWDYMRSQRTKRKSTENMCYKKGGN